MATNMIIDNQHALLEFDPTTKIIHHKLYQTIDSETLRSVLMSGVDLLKSHHATKWLSDNRDINAHSPEDTEWINNQWLPAAVAAGWKYWALVVPDDFMARVNMTEFVDSFYAKGIRIMVFTDLDKAEQWLQKL